jgi:hypothetical protein
MEIVLALLVGLLMLAVAILFVLDADKNERLDKEAAANLNMQQDATALHESFNKLLGVVERQAGVVDHLKEGKEVRRCPNCEALVPTEEFGSDDYVCDKCRGM